MLVISMMSGNLKEHLQIKMGTTNSIYVMMLTELPQVQKDFGYPLTILFMSVAIAFG